MKNKTTGVYSEREMKMMTFFHDAKNVIFKPLLVALTKLKISANVLSVGGGVVAVLSLVASFYWSEPLYFIIGVWVHMFFDGIDGSVARFQNKSCTFGSYVDCIFDHVGIISAAIFAYYFLDIGFLPILMYSVLYTHIIFASFVLGQIGDPYKYLLRPRLIFYAAITIDLLWSTSSTLIVTWILVALMSLNTLEGVYRLGKYVKREM